MKKKSWIKITLTIVIVLAAGIFYSCREKDNQKAVLSLQNQDSNTPISSINNQSNNEELDSWNEVQDDNKADQIGVSNENGAQINQETNEEITEEIYVHLCGAVKHPDVYQVDADTRLIDIIKLAGGLTDDAAGEYVNQAARVSDGEQIYIPSKDEVDGTIPFTIANNNNNNFSNNNDSTDLNVNKINLNTATRDELMTLTGIGESKADSIITYRQEHSGFKSIDEVKNINGIKDSVYNKICDKITVN